jgi:flagellar biosynthesis anti-sigma factor FlgM
MTMKITPKGPDTDLSQAIQTDKKVGISRQESDSAAQKSNGSASVNISPEARKLQRIAELAQKGDDLRADKVRALKAQVESGQYNVPAADVAKDIVRSEVARLFEKN